jgi:hypothetical protein
VDRHHPHPFARVGQPAAAAEDFEVVHSFCCTQNGGICCPRLLQKNEMITDNALLN